MIPHALFAAAAALFVYGLTKRRRWWAAAGAAALGLWPVASVVIASGLADALGCTVNEAATQPCPFAGVDWGGPLNTAFVSGWFMLVTLPLGLVLTVVAFVVTARPKAA